MAAFSLDAEELSLVADHRSRSGRMRNQPPAQVLLLQDDCYIIVGRRTSAEAAVQEHRVASDMKISVNESARLLAILASRCRLSIAVACRRATARARGREPFEQSCASSDDEGEKAWMRSVYKRHSRSWLSAAFFGGPIFHDIFTHICTPTSTEGTMARDSLLFLLSADGAQF
ncbi:hypothetical protein ACQR0Z_33270 [Bradyrhizobium sp. HKCCYLS3077]|uniref:hypothetical protein n=1 Tax=Bradyrhizobium sp. HKCCYLS3077 TaxID=3420761 RepID=UPI003EB77CDB